MDQPGGSATSLTLLGRLRRSPNDQQAWAAFVERYGRKIYGWGRDRGLQQADAQDVAQNVLLELSRQLRGFEYQPGGSFRAWLRTVAYRAWCDYLKARERVPRGDADDVLTQLAAPAAGQDLLQHLEAECERELLEEAMALVRLRVQPHTWQAFVQTALEGQAGAAVAERLQMNVGAVWVARSKVQKMLQEEVRRLEEAHDG